MALMWYRERFVRIAEIIGNHLSRFTRPLRYVGQWHKNTALHVVDGAAFKVRVNTADKLIVNKAAKARG